MVGVKGKSGGQNRKATSKLIAEGTYKPHRHADRLDAKVTTGPPPCPASLDDHGRDLWRRICEVLPREVITRLDTESLRIYCETWQMYCAVIPIMMADPIDKDTRITWSTLVDKLDKLGRQFGWTPQARAGITMPTKTDEEDPFETYLKQRAGRD
jgi:P27 family predicted phage terminase small subunit